MGNIATIEHWFFKKSWPEHTFVGNWEFVMMAELDKVGTIDFVN